MTPVKFEFREADGTPLANVSFEIKLAKAGFLEAVDGIVVPDVVTATTDELGVVTVLLAPSSSLYYLKLTTHDDYAEDCCHNSVLYKFYVPVSATVVRVQDLIISPPPSTLAWDEAAILVIMAAKTEAKASAIASEASAVRAEAAAVGVETYALAAEASAQEAAGFAGTASTASVLAVEARDEAETFSNQAQGSELAAGQSAIAAQGSAIAAAQDATQAQDSSEQAQASALAANQSNASASGFADSASASAASATASAQQADADKQVTTADRVAVTGFKADVVVLRNETKGYRDEALAALQSITGVISDGGPIDLSAGAYPPVPSVSTMWRVTVAGTVADVPYNVGDQLFYTKNLGLFYKLDGTENVHSVAGKIGDVLLNKADVGLSLVDNTPDVSKPVSSAVQLALDAKTAKTELASSLGASQVGYGTGTVAALLDVRWTLTIAAMRLAPAGTTGVIQVMEDGRGGFFKVDATVTADNDITTFISSSGVKFRRVYDGPINVRWAGAKCDKVTDDTVALQKVVDYCAMFTDWPAIQFPGPSLILGSLVVNREVLAHTDRAEWRIYGTGGTGGLHRVDATTTMLTSTLPMVNDPLSAWITWIDMRFTCPDRALGAALLSKNFLQQKFINCYFLRVKCGTTDKYWQSMFFDHCNFRYTPGVFLHSSSAGFDIHYTGCVSEYGQSYLNIFEGNLYSFSFTGGLHEGAFGGLLAGGGFDGVNITGNYFEYCQAPAIRMDSGNPNRAVTITGNFFATAAEMLGTGFYEIMWGNTVGGVSTGNYCHNGRLHDNSAMGVKGLDSMGDYAAIQLFKSPLLVSSFAATWAPTATVPITVVQAIARREGGIMHIDAILQFAASSASTPVVVSGLPLPSAALIFSGQVGYADLAGEVHLLGGAAMTNATASSFVVSKNRQGTRYTAAELSGVQLSLSITYSI